MVPLATPARLATSSSRVAAKPRLENSSSAAARMASRLSVPRPLRALEDLPADGVRAEPAPMLRRGGALSLRNRGLAIRSPMTDQSVIGSPKPPPDQGSKVQVFDSAVGGRMAS